MQKASTIPALTETCSGGTGCSHKEEWAGDVGGKALNTCSPKFSSAWPFDFPAHDYRGDATAVPSSACKDSLCARKQTVIKGKTKLSSLMRPNGLKLWLPALKKSIFYFLQAVAFQLSMEGRIFSSFSSTGALHLLGNPHPPHPLARGCLVWQVKIPDWHWVTEPRDTAYKCENFTQTLSHGKIHRGKSHFQKSIVIHGNTLSAFSKIAVWQFLPCKAAPVQEPAINPVSDEWTSKWKHPCWHSVVKHWQARAEAARQDAPLPQPWRKGYSEDKNWRLQ